MVQIKVCSCDCMFINLSYVSCWFKSVLILGWMKLVEGRGITMLLIGVCGITMNKMCTGCTNSPQKVNNLLNQTKVFHIQIPINRRSHPPAISFIHFVTIVPCCAQVERPLRHCLLRVGCRI